jgi:Holliday junction resolvasome RuvABC ATP-dependent DNA helicase subunit
MEYGMGVRIESMEEVIGQLKEINSKLDTIIGAMKKPDNKMARVFEVAATGVGILSIIDIIRNWLFGG